MLTLTLIATVEAIGDDAEKKKPCKEHPFLFGSCFKVRGRMSLANGSLNIRIWPVGSKRMLAVREGKFLLDGYENLPKKIERQLNWGNAIFGDFTVCPFEGDKPGHMRQVCVESAENISVRKF